MKTLFSVFLMSLILMSAVALYLQYAGPEDDRIPLVWCTDDCPARQVQIRVFEDQFPGYRITVDPDNNDMSKIIVQSTAMIGPDVFDIYAERGNLMQYYHAGILEDVTEEAQRWGFTPDKVWPALHQKILIDGRQFGFPTNAGTQVICYNKDVFDRFGVPYPDPDHYWTWDEFLEVAKKVTHARKDVPFAERIYGFARAEWREMIWQNGGYMFNENGTKCVIDFPEAIEAVQFLHDMIYKHGVMPTPVEEATITAAGGWGSSAVHVFGTGRIAMCRMGRWCLIPLREYDPPLRLGFCPVPIFKERKYWMYSRTSAINTYGEHKEDAVKFLRCLASEPYCAAVNDTADGMSAVMEYCQGPYVEKYMTNPQYEDERHFGVFADTAQYGVMPRYCPFLVGGEGGRAIQLYYEALMSNDMPVAEALHRAAREVNESIQKNVKRYPYLKELWDALTTTKSQGNRAAQSASHTSG